MVAVADAVFVFVALTNAVAVAATVLVAAMNAVARLATVPVVLDDAGMKPGVVIFETVPGVASRTIVWTAVLNVPAVFVLK